MDNKSTERSQVSEQETNQWIVMEQVAYWIYRWTEDEKNRQYSSENAKDKFDNPERKTPLFFSWKLGEIRWS